MSFYHDSTGVEDGSRTHPLMPDGWYMMKITDAEETKSKNGHNMIFLKCSPVNNDEYKDVSIWHYVTFIPKGEKGEGISVHFRKCIGVAFGGNDKVEAPDWVGRKFRAKIITSEYTSDKGTFKNNKIAQVETIQEVSEEEVPF